MSWLFERVRIHSSLYDMMAEPCCSSRLSFHSRKPNDIFAPEECTMILNGQHFKLRKLYNNAFSLPQLLPFLAQQSHLEIWHNPRAVSTELPADIAPMLADVEVPLWLLSMMTPRPITTVKLTLEREEAINEQAYLNAFGSLPHLKVLILMRDIGEGCSKLADFLLKLGSKAPEIEMLALFHLSGVRVYSLKFSLINTAFQIERSKLPVESTTAEVVAALASFRKLSVFQLSPAQGKNFNCFAGELVRDKYGFKTLSTFFSALPSLNRISFSQYSRRLPPWVHGWPSNMYEVTWVARNASVAREGDFIHIPGKKPQKNIRVTY
jgi:hypothetical protein